MNLQDIPMGSTVRDTITGFVGVVTGTASFINGAEQVQVTPTALKDGLPAEVQWLYTHRIQVQDTPAAPESPGQ